MNPARREELEAIRRQARCAALALEADRLVAAEQRALDLAYFAKPSPPKIETKDNRHAA